MFNWFPIIRKIINLDVQNCHFYFLLSVKFFIVKYEYRFFKFVAKTFSSSWQGRLFTRLPLTLMEQKNAINYSWNPLDIYFLWPFCCQSQFPSTLTGRNGGCSMLQTFWKSRHEIEWNNSIYCFVKFRTSIYICKIVWHLFSIILPYQLSEVNDW